MADFSLEDLKTLRERLGTGMVDSKNALVEAGGDLADLAVRNVAVGALKEPDGRRKAPRTEMVLQGVER